jgi:hypothetical protein
MLSNFAARVAENAIGIEVIFQPFKASIIGRKLTFEVLERVPGHPWPLNFGFAHRSPLSCLPTVTERV